MSVLVAGGTGNVGRHIVRALLRDGSTVVVTSRSRHKLDSLRAAAGGAGERLVALVGDLADERDGERLREEIARSVGSTLEGVVSSLGQYTNAPSLLGATRAELLATLESYVVAHFTVARTFLPVVAARGGSYTLINGPSAFGLWHGSGLVSIATAAQAMLARALMEEGKTGGARITEVVIHPSAYIGPDAAAGAENGGVDGPAVGRFVTDIVAGRVAGGGTVHLEEAGG